MPLSHLPDISAIIANFLIFLLHDALPILNISAPLHSKYLIQAPNSSSGFGLSGGMYFVMPRSKLPEISAILVDFRIFRTEKLIGRSKSTDTLHSKYLIQAPNSSSGIGLSSVMYFIIQ